MPNTAKPLPRAIVDIMKNEETPILIVDKKIIKRKYQEFHKEFCTEFSNAKIFFAVKCNPHPGVIGLLQEIGCDFEISSQRELDLLLRLKVPAERIILGNPVKEPAFIKASYDNNIDVYAFDSYTEIDKIARLAPGRKVCVRLSVVSEGSEWPLSKKFGVDIEQAVKLLVKAKEKGLNPYGITFHVGSQTTSINSWSKALERSKTIWDQVATKGIELKMLNIGGGFPIEYMKPVPSVADIAPGIRASLIKNFPRDVELILAPGRSLVGDSGVLITSVIGKADRGTEKWVYADIGVYNGLMETVGGIKYPMLTTRKTAVSKWVLSGPSCDSFDVVSNEVELPELEVGDRIYIMSAGGYTTAYASEFDGFHIPNTRFIE